MHWSILARLVAVATLLIGACPARADIDLSGRWTFELTSGFGVLIQCEDVTQTGMVLSTVPCTAGPSYSGTIDPVGGALTLSGPNDPECAPTVITATAAPDGQTFTGTYTAEEHACSFGCMCCFCIDTSGTITAQKECGNGMLDAGEACDDGNLVNGDCCDSTCQLDPDGTACDDGNSNTTGDECSAGACAGTLLPNHYLCRQVKDLKVPAKFVAQSGISVVDQTGADTCEAKKPFLLCEPVDKNGGGIPSPALHYCCYKLKCGLKPAVSYEVTDQFWNGTISTRKPKFLCNPCAKAPAP